MLSNPTWTEKENRTKGFRGSCGSAAGQGQEMGQEFWVRTQWSSWVSSGAVSKATMGRMGIPTSITLCSTLSAAQGKPYRLKRARNEYERENQRRSTQRTLLEHGTGTPCLLWGARDGLFVVGNRGSIKHEKGSKHEWSGIHIRRPLLVYLMKWTGEV